MGMRNVKKLTKVVDSFHDFKSCYYRGVEGIPPPFDFFVDGKKYRLKKLFDDEITKARIYDYQNDKIIDLPSSFYGKKFIWEINGIDYFKEYLYRTNILVLNLNNVRVLKWVNKSLVGDDEHISMSIEYNSNIFDTMPYNFREWVLMYIYSKAKSNNGFVII
jgi:hypothetical protein